LTGPLSNYNNLSFLNYEFVLKIEKIKNFESLLVFKPSNKLLQVFLINILLKFNNFKLKTKKKNIFLFSFYLTLMCLSCLSLIDFKLKLVLNLFPKNDLI